MQESTFKVEGMSCGHCQTAVARALNGVPGVEAADVSLERHEATVTYDPGRATVERLAAAVDEAGYRLVVA